MADGVKVGIRPVEFAGIVQLWGQPGVGKTTAALQFQAPPMTAFFDCDFGKGESRVARLGMLGEGGKPKRYFNIGAELQNKKEGEWWAVFADLPRRLPPKTDTVILDNIDLFQFAAMAYVEDNPKEFRLKPDNVAGSKWGGAYPGVNKLIGRWTQSLQAQGVKLIIVISHVKTKWTAGGQPIPGKFSVRGTDAWRVAANLMIGLHFSDGGSIPAATIWKDGMGPLSFNEETARYEAGTVFPKRIPLFSPAKLYGYLSEPADLANPKPDEVPTEEELAMYGEHFTSTQLGVIRESILAAEKATEEQRTLTANDRLATISGVQYALIGDETIDVTPIVAGLSAEKQPLAIALETKIPMPTVMKVVALLSKKK